MKSILTSLGLLLALVFTTVTPVLAVPGATLSTDSLRRYVFLSFTGLKEVSKVSYTLTYDSAGLTRGFEGLLRPKVRTSRMTKRQILGTCSSGRCVYHRQPTNIQLEVSFTTRSGKLTTTTKTLP